MRVADYIIDFIYRHGTDTIFTLAGGGAMFLNDAVVCHKKLRYICNHHELACAYAAEAYAKTKETIGAVMVTSGPGSTNAISGLLEAYQNSIPVIFLSSQAKRSQMIHFSGLAGLRQFGTQEVDIISIVKPLTKYAAIVENPEDIGYQLEKAYRLMLSGRPGPVWLDIPPDVASAPLPANLKKFIPEKQQANNRQIKKQLQQLTQLLFQAKKPLVIAGGGIKLAKARDRFRRLIKKLQLPVVVPDMGIDLLEYDHPLYIGHGGTKGDRAANIAIRNADLILVLGSRLAIPFIGHQYDQWAPNAKIVVVDIDSVEHRKKTVTIDLLINTDVRQLIDFLLSNGNWPVNRHWLTNCQLIKKNYALKLATVSPANNQTISMYDAVQEISRQSRPGDIFITDAGITAYVTTQSLKIKKNQRLILPGATLTMGYNLPAVIGIWAADKNRRIICITGDGSLQLNIHELATIAHHQIPARIFVINNQGYLAIRTTQKNFFQGRLIGESNKTGVAFPNLGKLASAYGFAYSFVKTKTKLSAVIRKTLTAAGPIICEVFTPYWQEHLTASSKQTADGKILSLPLDEMAPFLSEKQLLEIKKLFR